MIRGTTPTLEFTLPFDVTLIENAYITFSQNGEVVLEKSLSDCEKSADKLTLRLTQEDTLKFISPNIVEIQLRVKTFENDALASNIIKTSVEKILKDGVI